MDLDQLDVDGFMADLELAGDKDLLLEDCHHAHHHLNDQNTATAPMQPATGRRNRSDSDCSSIGDHSSSHKPRIKRSRKAGVTSAVAALATLATFVAVNTSSGGGGPSSWKADIPKSNNGGEVEPVAFSSSSSRLLQQGNNKDFDWEEPEQQHRRHEKQQHHDDSDWCKREENNPFGNFAGVGDFLCSLDLGSRFGFGDMEEEDDKNKDDDDAMLDFDFDMDTLSV